jgi:hypothetical protein
LKKCAEKKLPRASMKKKQSKSIIADVEKFFLGNYVIKLTTSRGNNINGTSSRSPSSRVFVDFKLFVPGQLCAFLILLCFTSLSPGVQHEKKMLENLIVNESSVMTFEIAAIFYLTAYLKSSRVVGGEKKEF